MSERALREHWIRGGLREWLSEYLRTESAAKLTAIQRMRLRTWGYFWPEHLHTFRVRESTDAAGVAGIFVAGVQYNFEVAKDKPTPLTWEEGNAPKGYAKRRKSHKNP